MLVGVSAWQAPGSATLEVSPNGQQYAEADRNFSFHSPMVATGVAPSSGPVEGGTRVLMRVENVSLTARQLIAELAPHYFCRFDETWRPVRTMPAAPNP